MTYIPGNVIVLGPSIMYSDNHIDLIHLPIELSFLFVLPKNKLQFVF